MSEPKALGLLRQGIAAARAGEKAEARRLLRSSAELNGNNDTVWLWLAIVAESPQKRIESLKRALDINPSNKRIHQMLKQMKVKYTPAEKSWKCPLCMQPAAKPVNPCPNCRAVLNIHDVDEVLASEADKEKMQRAIKGYLKVLGQGVDFGAHMNLALAYLNMQQIDEAITHLKGAIIRQPNDRMLKVTAAELRNRNEAIKATAAVSVELNGSVPKRGLILTVDDSPTIRKLVSLTLRRHEYDVAVAEDGMEALGKLNQIEPSLILLDITMPRMNGYQVCKVIRNNRETNHIPIVMLSGKDGFFDKVRGKMAGTSHYLTKPFDPAVLLQIVEKYALKNVPQQQ